MPVYSSFAAFVHSVSQCFRQSEYLYAGKPRMSRQIRVTLKYCVTWPIINLSPASVRNIGGNFVCNGGILSSMGGFRSPHQTCEDNVSSSDGTFASHRGHKRDDSFTIRSYPPSSIGDWRSDSSSHSRIGAGADTDGGRVLRVLLLALDAVQDAAPVETWPERPAQIAGIRSGNGVTAANPGDHHVGNHQIAEDAKCVCALIGSAGVSTRRLPSPRRSA